MSIRTPKYLGLLLGLISIVSIFVILHHPSIAAHDVQQQINEMIRESPENALVHGSLIMFVILISFCLTAYAQLVGLNYVFVLFGLLIYWLGTLAMITAALMSGFVGPDLAEIYNETSEDKLLVFVGLKQLSWLINQSFANLGAICWCVAMCFWGVHLYIQQAQIVITRLFAVASFIAGAGVVLSFSLGWLSLNVFGMTLVLVIVSIWQLGIAWLLFKHQ